jgi:spore maturation protein CgeB
MKIAIFGLSISSAWGNGHATLLRGLLKALHALGHEVHFFERDAPYYASHRDVSSFDYAHLYLYSDWTEMLPRIRAILADADAGMVTSYCPDGVEACRAVLDAGMPRTVFYDMDTPVTLDRLQRGEPVPYLPGEGLGAFDLVLSYTGGETLARLRSQLRAKCAATLYGWVDPEVHHAVGLDRDFEGDLSYLGTYSADRQAALEELFLVPARQQEHKQFVIGGAMYPVPRHWPRNVRHFEHIAPPQHSAFYSSSPVTLNITRGSMVSMGYCPSGRLFEAAACGTAVLSDWWEGLDTFFQPGEEILIAADSADTIAILREGTGALRRIGLRARQRALDCHTATIRAAHLIDLIDTPRDEPPFAQSPISITQGAY